MSDWVIVVDPVRYVRLKRLYEEGAFTLRILYELVVVAMERPPVFL